MPKNEQWSRDFNTVVEKGKKYSRGFDESPISLNERTPTVYADEQEKRERQAKLDRIALAKLGIRE